LAKSSEANALNGVWVKTPNLEYLPDSKIRYS